MIPDKIEKNADPDETHDQGRSGRNPGSGCSRPLVGLPISTARQEPAPRLNVSDGQ